MIEDNHPNCCGKQHTCLDYPWLAYQIYPLSTHEVAWSGFINGIHELVPKHSVWLPSFCHLTTLHFFCFFYLEVSQNVIPEASEHHFSLETYGDDWDPPFEPLVTMAQPSGDWSFEQSTYGWNPAATGADHRCGVRDEDCDIDVYIYIFIYVFIYVCIYTHMIGIYVYYKYLRLHTQYIFICVYIYT